MNQIHPDPTVRPPAAWAGAAEFRSAGNLEEVIKCFFILERDNHSKLKMLCFRIFVKRCLSCKHLNLIAEIMQSYCVGLH